MVGARILRLVRYRVQGLGDPRRLGRAQVEIPQDEQRFLPRGRDLLGDGPERRRQVLGVMLAGQVDDGGGPLVVPLDASADPLRPRRSHQARREQHPEVVGDVSLARREGGRELAGGGGSLTEREEQPVPRRVRERLEVPRVERLGRWPAGGRISVHRTSEAGA
jgi:hypothetical protein